MGQMGEFDLVKVIKFKEKLFSDPTIKGAYNRTQKRLVVNEEDWTDGLKFGTEQALRSVKDWLESIKYVEIKQKRTA